MADWLSMLCLNLQGVLPEQTFHYMTKERAITELRKLSGEDFGDDVEAWLDWVERYRVRIREKVDREMELERRARKETP